MNLEEEFAKNPALDLDELELPDMTKMKSRCTPERKLSTIGDLLDKDDVQATLSNYKGLGTDSKEPKLKSKFT